MPNFAQEFPLLLYTPLMIFAAVALGASFVHFLVLVSPKLKGFWARFSTLRQSITAGSTGLRSLEPQGPRSIYAVPAKPRLVSTKM